MRLSKPTLIDTIHLLAASAVIWMLIALVIARHQPAWTEFFVQSLAVLAGSAVLARLIDRYPRR